MEKDICTKCGSNKIIRDVKIVDYAHGNTKKNLSIHIKTTDKILFNKFEKSELESQICGSCGKVDLSVSNPHELWEAYLKNQAL